MKNISRRLQALSGKCPSATIGQRTALFHMYQVLGWDVKGIRDLSFNDASTAIDLTKKYITEHGFSKKDINDAHNED